MKEIFAKYSWKTKNRALILFSLVFGFCCYQLAIKETLEARRDYQSQHHNRDIVASARGRIASLKKRTGIVKAEAAQVENRASEKERMVALADELKIMVKNLAQEATVHENGKDIVYNAYYFAAPFTELLMLLSRAENEGNLNILNVRFYAEQNPVTKQRELIMKIETAMIKEV